MSLRDNGSEGLNGGGAGGETVLAIELGSEGVRSKNLRYGLPSFPKKERKTKITSSRLRLSRVQALQNVARDPLLPFAMLIAKVSLGWGALGWVLFTTPPG
jgi:hypothetical protein